MLAHTSTFSMSIMHEGRYALRTHLKYTLLTFGNHSCLMFVLCTKEKSKRVYISCILNAGQIHCDITVNVVRL